MSKNKTILLVEDEENIAYVIKVNLEAEGYDVVHCDTGSLALKELETNFFDLLLLDVMLPDYDGYHVCRQFREKDNLTPVVFVSASGDTNSRLKGLRIGADDYITKPFNLDELFLKIERLIFKNNARSKHEVVYFGNCWIDFTAYEAKGAQGSRVKMTKLEFDLARLLIDNENQAMSREVLYDKVWGYEGDNRPNSRTLDNFIVFLRRYFENDPAQPKHFLSVRSVGYKFKR
jgi:two-component system alkaline phosphatase synthesis response regulator PhoP